MNEKEQGARSSSPCNLSSAGRLVLSRVDWSKIVLHTCAHYIKDTTFRYNVSSLQISILYLDYSWEVKDTPSAMMPPRVLGSPLFGYLSDIIPDIVLFPRR